MMGTGRCVSETSVGIDRERNGMEWCRVDGVLSAGNGLQDRIIFLNRAWAESISGIYHVLEMNGADWTFLFVLLDAI